MKKLLLVVFMTTLFLFSCENREVLDECVTSSQYAVWGDRVYSVQNVSQKGNFLTYSEIDDKEGTVYIACPDPLCSHEKSECSAYAGYGNSQIALVPLKNSVEFYFFRGTSEFNDPNDPTQGFLDQFNLMSLNMKNGKSSVVVSFPFRVLDMPYIIADGYVYFTFNSSMMTGEYADQSVNIWRASLNGGKIEQCTFSEDVMSGYRMEHFEDGVFYYRRGNTLCSTSDDFATENILIEDLDLLWRIVISDGWVYYTDDRKVITVTPNEEKSQNHSHVYGYTIGEYPSALDAANSCSIVRERADRSGEKEVLATGVKLNILSPSWCMVGDVLYYVPSKFEFQGTVEWSTRESPNSISYIWSETGGELCSVDLKTREYKTVYTDLGYDIESIEYTGKGKLFVVGEVYDINSIKAHFEANPILSPIRGYKVWRLLDID